jgi:ORF6N domain-containing protein
VAKSKNPLRVEGIARAILVLRGQRVILDRELAAIYGVSTGRLNEAVKRNAERFPEDFMFQLTAAELENLRSQFANSSWGGRRYRPFAFTEHGAIQAANVLNSPRAITMGVHVVRAFVRLREILASNKDLAHTLIALERSLLALDLKTQRQFREVYEAIRALMDTPAPNRRGIGFTADLEEN